LIPLFFLYSFVSAQNSRDTETLFAEARNLLYKKPSESAVITEFLAKNTSDHNDQLKALLLLAESHLLRGDFNQASEKLFQCLELSQKSIQPENEYRLNFLLARLCDELGIEFSQLYLIKAEKDIRHNYYEKAIKSYTDSNWNQVIKDLKSFEKQKNKSFPELSNFFYALSYLNLGKLDSAQYFSHKIQTDTPYYFYVQARLKSVKKESDQSIHDLKILNPLETNVEDVFLREEIYQLSANLYETKNREEYRHFYQLQTALKDSMNKVRENARIVLLNKVGKKQDEILDGRSAQRQRMMIFIGIAIVLVWIIAYFINLTLNQKQKVLRKAASEAAERKQFLAENRTPENAGKIVIPDKTVSNLLAKLNQFESGNDYLHPDISLALLADKLNTNTKYLSEVINNHKHKNFHSYINELRVNYIIRKIKSNPVYLKYKVSHLAEEAGFSSHSLFSTVFKQVTGHSPASFIKNVKNQ